MHRSRAADYRVCATAARPHALDQRLRIARHLVAAPRHVLVVAHQHQRVATGLRRGLAHEVHHRQRNAAGAGGRAQGFHFHPGVQAQQRVALAESVVERAPVRPPETQGRAFAEVAEVVGGRALRAADAEIHVLAGDASDELVRRAVVVLDAAPG